MNKYNKNYGEYTSINDKNNFDLNYKYNYNDIDTIKFLIYECKFLKIKHLTNMTIKVIQILEKNNYFYKNLYLFIDNLKSNSNIIDYLIKNYYNNISLDKIYDNIISKKSDYISILKLLISYGFKIKGYTIMYRLYYNV